MIVYTLMGPLLGFTIYIEFIIEFTTQENISNTASCTQHNPHGLSGVASRPPSDGASTF
jgi:hypothetical protein